MPKIKNRESHTHVDVSESDTNQSSAKHFRKQFTMECRISSNSNKDKCCINDRPTDL